MQDDDSLRGHRIANQTKRSMPPLTRRARFVKALGYAGDILVIAFIVGAGLYVMNHPEKIDLLLNWVLRRN